MRIFKLLIIAIIGVTFFSCEPTYEKEYSWAYPIAGDWKLMATVDGKPVSWAPDPFEIKIYNSSFGQDSIWIDDYATTSSNGHFYSFKLKAAANMTDKTFSSVGSINAVPKYGIEIKVTGGQVIGTDSIIMNLEFADDAGTIYKLAGRRIVSYEDYMAND